MTYLQWGGRFWWMDENIIFLSKLFSQMWTMSSSAEITDDGIIDRALSSPFFPKCVEAYREYPNIQAEFIYFVMISYQNAQFPFFIPYTTNCRNLEHSYF